MAQEVINNGNFEGDTNAESVYKSFEKSKNNFSDLYTQVLSYADGEGKTYEAISEAMAVTPLPDDYTPFKVLNDRYIYLSSESGGYLELPEDLGEISSSNTSKPVSGADIYEAIILKADLEVGNQLFNKDEGVTLDSFMSSSGSVNTSTSYVITDFIPVEPDTDYVGNQSYRFSTFFDENKNVISGGSNSERVTLTTVSDVKFVKLTLFKSIYTNYMFNKGTVSLPFEDYSLSIKSEYFDNVKEDFIKSTFENSSFNTYTDLTSKVKSKYSDSISDYVSTSNSSNITNEVVNGIYRFGGTYDYTAPFTRVWSGFDIKPDNYATEDKDYVLILKGSVTATNGDDFVYIRTSTGQYDIVQDLEDGVTSNFEVMFDFSFLAGNTSNARYTYCDLTRKDTNIDSVSYLAEFEIFSLFEKIEGFTINDYINASKDDLIVPVYTPKGTATEDYVNTKVNSVIGNISKLTSNDYTPLYDVEMLASGGQSLNVGDGASDSSTDWKNTPSFALGNSLYSRDFTTQAEKDAFFGTEFGLMETNTSTQYTPVTASLNSVISLLESENNVDVSAFGSSLMPFTWGLSGSSITSMVKGTTAYNDFIECVSKAKEFSNKEGKTFGVRSMNWYHGEADRTRTKQSYYDLLSQLFIDINTDVKAITGQSEDVQFFTYQTSPWIGRYIGSYIDYIGVQEAQIQVAKDFENVHLSGAMYQFSYSDYYHPTDRAVIGLQTGITQKRVLYDNENWRNFFPVSHNVITDGDKFYTHLKFDVPVKPIRFDISGDDWHNPNGVQPNFGFEILDSNEDEQQIEEPFITKGDTVVLTTLTDPTNMVIRYAVNGHDGGGNLCDSQNIIIRNKGIDYTIDNFAVAFSEYLID